MCPFGVKVSMFATSNRHGKKRKKESAELDAAMPLGLRSIRNIFADYLPQMALIALTVRAFFPAYAISSNTLLEKRALSI